MSLLEAGIDVYTTLNVQHLESLNDVIAQITGVVVRETVPDSIFEQADEVELVDLPPDDLLERLREGKVYIPREAERAMANFFTKGNLIALRELALRRTAERVGAQMDVYREEHAVRGTWPARERLLVCVGPSPFAARLVRATRRMAASLKSPWVAAHVETPAAADLSETDRQQLLQTMRLAEQLGGETATLSGSSVADELIHYARSRNVTRIVAGKPQQPRWKELLRGSLVYELTRKCGDIDVYVISGDPQSAPARSVQPGACAARACRLFLGRGRGAGLHGPQRAGRALHRARQPGQRGDDLPVGRGGGCAEVRSWAVDSGVAAGGGRLRFLLRAAALDVRGRGYAVPADVPGDAADWSGD